MIRLINFLFVTMFGLGKVKFIPGTIGSLTTLFILYFCFNILKINPIIIFLGLLIIFFYSFIAVTYYIRTNENKDPREIIIDEFIGQSIPIYLYEISHGATKHINETMLIYGICFILFRYFDIMKPFPVSFFDKKYKNSFGVIMDDVCAGFYVVLSLVCFMLLKGFVL